MSTTMSQRAYGHHIQLLAMMSLCVAWVSMNHRESLAASMMPGRSEVSVEEIEIPVADLERSVRFYRDVLGFKEVTTSWLESRQASDGPDRENMSDRRAALHLGAERIVLSESNGRPVPKETRSHDRWFQHIAIVTSDMNKAYDHLRRHRVRHVSGGPQRLPDWNPKTAGIRAFYFHDPDQHTLEIIQFPRGKGSPRWQEADEELFRGIDHTAMVVADTDTSVEFYRDRLGFEIVGESENFGPEQERLNNVFNARLRITSLKAPSGPGIELLEYLSPSDGRAYPADSRSNDLWCWKTRLLVPDTSTSSPSSLEQTPKRASIVSRSNDGVATVVDPDGHRLQLTFVGSKGKHHVQGP